MKVYIAGPMRGIERWNFDAFDQAEDEWRGAGHTPISPAAMDRLVGNDPDAVQSMTEGSFMRLFRRAIMRDLRIIADECDAVAVLPGWELSKGAQVEVALAVALGLPVYRSDDPYAMKDIKPAGGLVYTVEDVYEFESK